MIVCSISWTKRSICQGMYSISNWLTQVQNILFPKSIQILLTDKVLPTVRHGGKIWGKKYCLKSPKITVILGQIMQNGNYCFLTFLCSVCWLGKGHWNWHSYKQVKKLSLRKSRQETYQFSPLKNTYHLTPSPPKPVNFLGSKVCTHAYKPRIFLT